MPEQIPTVGMCNLMGDDFTLNDILIYHLSDFLKTHPNMVFPHRHSFFQILYFTKSGGKHTIDFDGYEAEAGQIYFMIPGQVHTWSFTDNTEGFLVNFTESFFSSVFINPHYISDFPFFSGVSGDNVLKVPKKLQPELQQLFTNMQAECKSQLEYKYDFLRAKLVELFVLVSRKLMSDKTSKLTRHNYLILRNFQKLIEQQYKVNKLPREYAELLFITPNHLNALCKSTLGKAAGEIIRDRVLLEAKRLLVNSDFNVSQISHQLNFDDPSYFVKFFKKYIGVTPEEFRKTKLAIK